MGVPGVFRALPISAVQDPKKVDSHSCLDLLMPHMLLTLWKALPKPARPHSNLPRPVGRPQHTSETPL